MLLKSLLKLPTFSGQIRRRVLKFGQFAGTAIRRSICVEVCVQCHFQQPRRHTALFMCTWRLDIVCRCWEYFNIALFHFRWGLLHSAFLSVFSCIQEQLLIQEVSAQQRVWTRIAQRILRCAVSVPSILNLATDCVQPPAVTPPILIFGRLLANAQQVLN